MMRISDQARLSISLMPCGWPVRTITCQPCKGSGKRLIDPWDDLAICHQCSGTGRVPENRSAK